MSLIQRSSIAEQLSGWILTPARIVRHPLVLSALATAFLQLPVLSDEVVAQIVVLGSATAVGAAWGTRKNSAVRARVRKNIGLFVSRYLRRPDRGEQLNAASRAVLDAVRGRPSDDPEVIAAKQRAIDLAENGFMMDVGEPWFADKYIARYALRGFVVCCLLYPLMPLYLQSASTKHTVASSPLSPRT